MNEQLVEHLSKIVARVETEIDNLRKENLKLKDESELLRKRISELESYISNMEKSRDEAKQKILILINKLEDILDSISD